MATKYKMVRAQLGLTAPQLSRLQEASANSGPVNLRLNASQIGAPSGLSLMLPPSIARKLARRKQMGKGMDLKLSRTTVGKNKRGGFIHGAFGKAVIDSIPSGANDWELLLQGKCGSGTTGGAAVKSGPLSVFSPAGMIRKIIAGIRTIKAANKAKGRGVRLNQSEWGSLFTPLTKIAPSGVVRQTSGGALFLHDTGIIPHGMSGGYTQSVGKGGGIIPHGMSGGEIATHATGTTGEDGEAFLGGGRSVVAPRVAWKSQPMSNAKRRNKRGSRNARALGKLFTQQPPDESSFF